MRIAFTGGGTGGHVFPNIAVIREVRVSRSEADEPFLRQAVFYIGEKASFEEKIAKAEGISFYGIHAGKLRRYFDIRNFIDLFKIPIGVVEAFLILKKIKPDLVFAKGGYVSVPVVLAAALLRVPIWIHESDVSPGLATKICSKFAQKIWLSFEESRGFFPGKNAEVVGNPIRKEVLDGSREQGCKITGFSKDKPVVLIMGGSSGAESLNELVEKILPELLKEAQVAHVTGGGRCPCLDSAEVTSGLIWQGQKYRCFEFLGAELPHIYAIADIVVSRAGSGSIFEVLALNKPMILVPLSAGASRGDQIENSQVFEKHGWARVLDQEKLSPQEFLENIRAFLRDKKVCTEMIEKQKCAPFKDAAGKIAAALCIPK